MYKISSLIWGTNCNSFKENNKAYFFYLCSSSSSDLSQARGYFINTFVSELDGVGPVDKRPSTDYLHRFEEKKERKKSDIWQVTGDTWQVTRDRWQVTRDMWHVTPDTWCGVNILSKFHLSSSNGLGLMMFWRFWGKVSLNQQIN